MMLLVVACGTASSESSLSESDVRDFLGDLSRAAADERPEEICSRFALSDLSFCLENSPDESVRPSGDPKVECMAPSADASGWWVVLTGETTTNESYRSRLFVTADNEGSVVAQIPFFWTGLWTEPAPTDGEMTAPFPPEKTGECSPES